MSSIGNSLANGIWEANLKGRTKVVPSSSRYENVSAFKGPLLNEALLLQYDNFLGDPLVFTNLEMVPALHLPGTCALAGQTAAHVV